MGWTSIYQLFWGSPGVQGFDTLPYLEREREIDFCWDSSAVATVGFQVAVPSRSNRWKPLDNSQPRLAMATTAGLCAVCSKWPESTVVIMFGSAVQRTYKKGHLSLQVTVHVFALLGHVAVFLPVVVPSSHIAAQWWLKWVHKANSCGLVLSNSVFDLVFCFPLSETSNVVLLQQLTQNHGSLYSWLFMYMYDIVWHCMTLYDMLWDIIEKVWIPSNFPLTS